MGPRPKIFPEVTVVVWPAGSESMVPFQFLSRKPRSPPWTWMLQVSELKFWEPGLVTLTTTVPFEALTSRVMVGALITIAWVGDQLLECPEPSFAMTLTLNVPLWFQA